MVAHQNERTMMKDVAVHTNDSFCASVKRVIDHGPALSLPSHESKPAKAVETD